MKCRTCGQPCKSGECDRCIDKRDDPAPQEAIASIAIDAQYAISQLLGICQVDDCTDRASDRIQLALNALERMQETLKGW